MLTFDLISCRDYFSSDFGKYPCHIFSIHKQILSSETDLKNEETSFLNNSIINGTETVVEKLKAGKIPD